MTTATTASTPGAAAQPTAQPQAQPGGQAAPGKAQETAQAQAQRMMRLKIEGQELELPESEVISLAQQGKQAGKKFQEAAQMRKEAEALAQLLKSNPKEALSKFGIDVRKFSEDTLVEMLQREAETPEQRKARENEEKLSRYEKEEKARLEAEREAQLKALEEKHLKNYNDMFIQALESSGLPKTPYTVKRMAELQLLNVKKGFDLDPAQLAKIVREDYIAEQKALFGSADGNTLMEILGPDIVKKLSKAQIAKLKAQTQSYQKADEKTKAPERSDKSMSWREIQRRNLGLK